MSKRNKYLILITTIMFCVLVDIWIGAALNNHENQHASLYRTALKTTDKDRFNYIIDSHQGNVVTNTKLTAADPVRFHEMKSKQKFFAVKRTLEEYTMHTETTTDSKGHTTTRTYWTWDDQGTDSKYSRRLEIFGRKYKTSNFDINSYFAHVDAEKLVNDNNGLSGYYHYIDSDTRYRYEVIPVSITGSFIANTNRGTLAPISGEQIKISSEHYKDYLNYNLHGGEKKVILVVVLLILIEILGIAYLYPALDEVY